MDEDLLQQYIALVMKLLGGGQNRGFADIRPPGAGMSMAQVPGLPQIGAGPGGLPGMTFPGLGGPGGSPPGGGGGDRDRREQERGGGGGSPPPPPPPPGGGLMGGLRGMGDAGNRMLDRIPFPGGGGDPSGGMPMPPLQGGGNPMDKMLAGLRPMAEAEDMAGPPGMGGSDPTGPLGGGMPPPGMGGLGGGKFGSLGGGMPPPPLGGGGGGGGGEIPRDRALATIPKSPLQYQQQSPVPTGASPSGVDSTAIPRAAWFFNRMEGPDVIGEIYRNQGANPRYHPALQRQQREFGPALDYIQGAMGGVGQLEAGRRMTEAFNRPGGQPDVEAIRAQIAAALDEGGGLADPAFREVMNKGGDEALLDLMLARENLGGGSPSLGQARRDLAADDINAARMRALAGSGGQKGDITPEERIRLIRARMGR